MEGVTALWIPILAVVGFFTAVIVWLYLHYSSRYKERMALLEHEKDAGIFKVVVKDYNNALKYGIVSVMIGVGTLIGYVMEQTGMNPIIAYSAMILLTGGLGLVRYYFLMEKKVEKDKKIHSDTLSDRTL